MKSVKKNYFYVVDENSEKYKNQIRNLELKNSELKFELEDLKLQVEEEKGEHLFYQLIADFTFGWELWLEPGGKIKYCSPSCFDLSGFTANQILASSEISELLVYELDKDKYNDFIARSLDQLLVNQTLEFRILTRSKQLRWCMMNVRGVYDKTGRYLGIRASVHDISRLKKAMGHIHEMETTKEFENRTRQRLQTQISSKDRELVTLLLQLSQKNELLAKLTNHIKKLQQKGSSINLNQQQQLLDLLENNAEIQLDWAVVENQVEKLHPGFINRLQIKHPGISLKDKKLCVYLRLGLSSKEISGLLNITPKSVEIARVRLRKKFKLATNIRLVNYLSQF